PSNAPVLVKAKEKDIQVISEIELAYNFCKGKIIAITGTNGKTTTTSLCGHIFKTSGVKTFIAGNIGTAFSEVVPEASESDFIILEISSFQLDLIKDFRPNVGMILNITPDHLNRYENKFENYINSKLRIYKNQDNNDYLILNKDDETLINSLTNYASKGVYFSLNEPQLDGCYLAGEQVIFNIEGKVKFTCDISEINLNGEHNIANAMAAITAAKIFGLDNEKIREGLKTFQGVEHRLEFVRELNGVKFINDSKATNVDSVWYALRSFSEPIFLILGGQDKGNDYNKIKQLVISEVKVEVKPSMEDVVIAANQEARESEIVLLSPACASFDMFDNYEHRGKIFKEAVNNL
ncbi:MAG: UDP-N-acetylmuramoyl-L-alanine--D-glutamate ligase, partial [Ignavibacteriaceae bacterium]